MKLECVSLLSGCTFYGVGFPPRPVIKFMVCLAIDDHKEWGIWGSLHPSGLPSAWLLLVARVEYYLGLANNILSRSHWLWGQFYSDRVWCLLDAFPGLWWWLRAQHPVSFVGFFTPGPSTWPVSTSKLHLMLVFPSTALWKFPAIFFEWFDRSLSREANDFLRLGDITEYSLSFKRNQVN